MSNENQLTTPAVRREELTATETRSQSELATTASAEQQRALVESQYMVAMRRPRNMLTVRSKLLAECERPRFAELAEYSLPFKKKVDGNWVTENVKGLSIRFAEAALTALGNIMIRTAILIDDSEKTLGEVVALDLESNVMHTEPFMTRKVVERKEAKEWDVVLDRRVNALGEHIYVVAAKEGDVEKKLRASIQKAKRNAILEILPADIKEEATEKCRAVVDKGIKDDPKAYTKRLCDGFSSLGVTPEMLEQFLGHALDACKPDEILELKEVYSSLRDGASDWPAIMEQGRKVADAKPLTDDEKKARGAMLQAIAKTNVERPQVVAAALKTLQLPPTSRADAMSFPLLQRLDAAVKAELEKAAAAPADAKKGTK